MAHFFSENVTRKRYPAAPRCSANLSLLYLVLLYLVPIVCLIAGCSKKANELQKLAADQPIRCEARLDRAIAAIGDRIVFTVQAVARKGVDVYLPFDLQTSAGLEIKDVQTPKTKNIGSDQFVYRREWTLSPSKVGAYILEPLEVSYTIGAPSHESKTIKTAAVYLDVRSVLKEGDLEGDIRDIKGPVQLPSRFWLLLSILGGAVVLSALVMVGYKVWKGRATPVPPLLPHEWALKELDELLGSGLLESGKYKEFTERLSWIFRCYVERRFGLMAPERTTEEFIEEMRERPQFNQGQQELLGKFLAFCDMIKFAKYAPTPSEMSAGVKIVGDFVQETKLLAAPAKEKGMLASLSADTAKVA